MLPSPPSTSALAAPTGSLSWTSTPTTETGRRRSSGSATTCSPLAVTADGFREAGRRLGALGLPTVVVQEGGYVLDTVGALALAALEGLDETR